MQGQTTGWKLIRQYSSAFLNNRGGAVVVVVIVGRFRRFSSIRWGRRNLRQRRQSILASPVSAQVNTLPNPVARMRYWVQSLSPAQHAVDPTRGMLKTIHRQWASSTRFRIFPRCTNTIRFGRFATIFQAKIELCFRKIFGGAIPANVSEFSVTVRQPYGLL